MKRKWFTLLFALVALASFQVNAAAPVKNTWIKVDTTGLAGNLPYSGNKVSPLANWLVTSNYTLNAKDANILTDGKINQFNVYQVGNNDRQLNIKWVNPDNGTEASMLKLDLPNNNQATVFEVVQFANTDPVTGLPIPSTGNPNAGFTRTTQALAPGMEGYLMPAQGGDGVSLQDTTASMWMVVKNNAGNLLIKRFDDVFTRTSAPAPVFDGSIFFRTTWPTYNYAAGAAGIAGNITTLNGVLPASQEPLAAGTIAGGYSRELAYLTPAGQALYGGVAAQFSDPIYTTKYKGPGPAIPADILTNAAYWTNGLPFFYDAVGANDGYGASPSGILNPNTGNPVELLLVVQVQPAGGAVATATVQTGIALTPAASLNGWEPIYIKLVAPAGRWAKAEDFVASKYWKFDGLNAVEAVKLESGAPLTPNDYYTTFAPFVADWIAMDSTQNSQKNIISKYDATGALEGTEIPGYSTLYQNSSFKKVSSLGNVVGGGTLGLQMDFNTATGGGGGTTPAIPLFVLATPDCKVLSVSRQNDLEVQRQPDGLYANKLEVRDYGTYYDYFKDGKVGTQVGTYTAHISSSTNPWDLQVNRGDTAGIPAGLREDRVATSLQKFAIWIDIYGKKTIYPVASYFWKYGETKKSQPSNVVPNSVLMYNNTDVTQTTGGVAVADQGWGVKITTWKPATAANTPKQGDVVTGPNVIQTNTDYTEYATVPTTTTVGTAATIGDYWFFLDVPSAKGTLKGSGTQGQASQLNAYQDDTQVDYVLSYGTRADGTYGLIMLPKEKVRAYGADAKTSPLNKWYEGLKAYKAIEHANPDGTIPSQYLLPDYWSNNPFDSINMHAHWKAIKISDGKYQIVNMLGEALGGTVNGAPITWNVSASGDNFVLSKADGTVLTLDGDWAQGVTRGKSAWSDSIYWQKNIGTQTPVNPTATFPFVVGGQLGCVSGLALKTAPIYYVPTYAASYSNASGMEEKNGEINTNDPNYKDDIYMYKDSLTAYLYLHGSYGIREAWTVENKLLLDTLRTETGVLAAALSPSTDVQIEFIPLSSVYAERNTAIDSKKGGLAAAGVNTDKNLDPYKWFLVKKGDQYLQFDTLNPGATNNRLKVGLTFSKVANDIANATPVRLYQPLVGDKLQGNFIFQFYIPVNTYLTPTTSYRNLWPAIESNVVSDTWDISLNGKLVWGQLGGGQSNYILANSDQKFGTRFTYIFQAPKPVDCCPEQFIEPNWMASQKLLSLPLNNQIWSLTSGLGLGFVNGGVNKNEAVVESRITEVKFTLVDSIKAVTPGANGGVFEYGSGTNAGRVATFWGDVDVPLYNITQTGADGKTYYLTVSDTTYMFDSRSTAKDVTGVNLKWTTDNYATKYGYNSDSKVNMPALQLFAISGNETKGPDKNGWYTECQSYVYLPLASYKAVYKTGSVDKSEIFYNTGLGKGGTSDCAAKGVPVNDVTKAFRVGYYSGLYADIRDQKNLAVMNASGQSGDVSLASMVPVASKWQKLKYDKIGCDYQTVYDVNGKFYYAAGGPNYEKICVANTNTMLAHWAITRDNANDEYLHTFTPEALAGYGAELVKQTQLNSKGGYYFLVVPAESTANTTVVRVFDFNTYATDFNIKESKLAISCVDHTLPFFDLGSIRTLPSQLAILEAPYIDRSLSDHSTDGTSKFGPTAIDTKSYQAYLNKILPGADIEDGDYLTAYASNVRQLDANTSIKDTHHIIPYFVFSKTTKDGTEYFLNVHPKAGTVDADSVYWTKEPLGKTREAFLKEVVENWEANPDFAKLYKFCLPYQVYTYSDRDIPAGKKVGDLVTPVKYGDTEYQPVYLQTLDVAKDDYPYLVIAGSATRYATTVRLNDAIQYNTGTCSFSNSLGLATGNIYTVDYAQVDPYKVTSWIFGGKRNTGTTEWVPLNNSTIDGVIVPATTTGYLTDFRLQGGGVTFLDESAQGVNWGIITGIKNSVKLNFEYEGTEQIGSSYAKTPIYYYRISIPSSLLPASTGKPVYLTDSYAKNSDYDFTYQNVTSKLAYFDATKKDDNLAGTATGTKYDGTFTQSLALRYVDVSTGNVVVSDGSVKDQTFVVVANADYTKGNSAEYRYLQDVGNNHLAFVKGAEGLKNAMVFQFGSVANGDYTGIEAVGTVSTFGVTGGVKLLNQAGTVVNIYSVDGSLLKSVQVTSADQTVDAPRGVVIVKSSAGNATKVVVK